MEPEEALIVTINAKGNIFCQKKLTKKEKKCIKRYARMNNLKIISILDNV